MNNYQQVLNGLLTTVLTVTIPILLRYAVIWIKSKIVADTTNSNAKYLSMAVDAIYAATLETTQTYVNALKDKNLFDKDAQKIALQMSLEKAKQIMGEEVRNVLESIVGDINVYITSQIESIIATQPHHDSTTTEVA